MRSNSNLAMMIVLSIVGVMLVMGSIILVLRGLEWINQIPGYIVGAMLMLALGSGILIGIWAAR